MSKREDVTWVKLTLYVNVKLSGYTQIKDSTEYGDVKKALYKMSLDSDTPFDKVYDILIKNRIQMRDFSVEFDKAIDDRGTDSLVQFRVTIEIPSNIDPETFVKGDEIKLLDDI